MANSSPNPKSGDVVLGGQSPAPTSGVVLGGLEGIKQRWQASLLLRPHQQKEIEVVTVDNCGAIISRESKEVYYFTEDLGNGVTMEMVAIPPGEFMMGSPAEELERYYSESPQHRVKIKAFYMGRFQVTQAQWQAVEGYNPSSFKGESRPVESVGWNSAQEFCRLLSQRTGRKYRLPSEAEWEYACRAETVTPFYFGSTITTDLVNYDGNSIYGASPKGKYRKQTTEVGSFSPNAFGLYDMHGNVWEWCEDVWHEDYNGAPTDGSAWVTGGDSTVRLLRGGSWLDIPRSCRSANRNRFESGCWYYNFGFRVICYPPKLS